METHKGDVAISERFYDKFLSFFLGFALLICSVMVTSELLIVWLFSQNALFYYGYLVALFLSILYGIKLYLKYSDFRQNLALFLPPGDKKLEPLEIDVDNDNLALQVCLYYRNGASFEIIKQNLNLSCSNEAKRKLIKGLDILLKAFHKGESKIGP